MPPITLYADCTGPTCDDEHKFRVIIWSQLTSCPPEVHYQEKDASSPRVVDVKKKFSKDGYLPFAFLDLEYRTSHVSFWSLTYNRDESHTAALTRETIYIIGFPFKLGLKIPGEVSTQSMKIFYNRAFFQNRGFEFGGALGLQILGINARAEKPFWGMEEQNYIAPLPAFGLYASYLQSDRLTYSLRANYFSLGSLSVGSVTLGGVVAEADLSVEYQFDRSWIIGAGYRLSYLDIDVEEENYHLHGSHVAYGPKLFIGASF